MRCQQTGDEVTVRAIAVIGADLGQSKGFSLLEDVGETLVATTWRNRPAHQHGGLRLG